MCAPAAALIPIISLGLSGAEAVTSYASSRGNANRTAADQKKLVEENTRAVVNAERLNQADLLHRQSEELLATATTKGDADRAVQMDLSTERVAAAEAGVGGNSVDAVLADIKNQGSREQGRLDVNSRLTQDQLNRQKVGSLAQAQSNINSIRPVHVNKPSLITPIFTVAEAGLKTYDYLSNRSAKAKTGGTP